jgi:glycosyltransferase involved in cell wall biosynthesis
VNKNQFYSDLNNNDFKKVFSIEIINNLHNNYIKSINDYLIDSTPKSIYVPVPKPKRVITPTVITPTVITPEDKTIINSTTIKLDDKPIFKNYLLTNNIEQIYISNSLIHLKDMIIKQYNLKTYNDISKPCLFFGAYSFIDFETIKYHKSFTYIMFGGTDVNNLKNINIKPDTKIISISKDIQERLKKNDVKNEYINLHNIEIYQGLNFFQKIGVVTSTNKLNSIHNIVKNFKQQLYSNKKLFIIINNNEIDIEEYKQYCEKADIEYDLTFINEKYNLGYCLNIAIKKLKEQNFDIFSKFDDDDIYESNYLIEQVNHINNIDCEIVGKYNVPIFIPEYNYFYKINYSSNENIYTETCLGATITFLLKKIDIKFNEELIEGVDIEFLQNIIKNKGQIYSSSFNNYIWVRFNDNTKHTSKYNIKEKYQLNKIDNSSEYYNLYMNLINHTFVKTDHLLVSVIVTMFNSENTIECCINSMINQTHKNLEIVIVDDSSKDNSVNIVKNIIKTNKNIKLIENPINKGTYHCKNLGLQQINDLTEYIAFQDSDDYSHMDRIRKQVEILHLSSGKMSFSLCERVSSYRMAPITQVMQIDIFKKILGYFDNNRFGADSEYYYRFMKYFNLEMKGKYTFDLNSSFYKNIEGIYYVIPYLLYIINRNDENCLTSQIQLNSNKRVTYKNNYIKKINELNNLYYGLEYN